MIRIGDRVRYNLSADFRHFWLKEGTVIGRGGETFTGVRTVIVEFDEPVSDESSEHYGDSIIEFGVGCFQVINSERIPEWEV